MLYLVRALTASLRDSSLLLMHSTGRQADRQVGFGDRLAVARPTGAPIVTKVRGEPVGDRQRLRWRSPNRSVLLSNSRSQRALERDLDTALKVGDSDALQHWKLVTKDGSERHASEVTVEIVKQLQNEGHVPVWYVRESYLAAKHGRKGMAKPTSDRQKPTGMQSQPTTESATTTPAHAAPGDKSNPLPDDVAFLKERIRTLERERREEAERNGQREAKLFEQLAVKDKQISAWDEVTQGLTKALATGQLKPDVGTVLLSTPTPAETREVENAAVRDAEVVTKVTKATAVKPVSLRATERERRRRQPNPSRHRKAESVLKQQPRERSGTSCQRSIASCLASE